MDDLTDRLQALAAQWDERSYELSATLNEAADRIAALEAERNALVHDIEGYVKAASEQAADILRLEAERDAFKATLHDELDENLRLRELGGARPDEGMTAFIERVIAERDALRAVTPARTQAMADEWDSWAAENRGTYECFAAVLRAAIDAARTREGER